MPWTQIALFLLAAAGFAALWVYYKRVLKLSDQEALNRAVAIAWQIWQVSGFRMPARLGSLSISPEFLREAGLVLKAEVVGQSTQASALPRWAAKAHPELAGVDPVALALQVQDQILDGKYNLRT